MRRALLILSAALTLGGCGGYAGTSEAFRRSMTDGEGGQALELVNKALGVERAEDLPSRPGKETSLLLLERGTILQSLHRYKLSSRDLQVADAKLDFLDLANDTAGSIGKYLYSDDATVYKAPAHEKLLLNTINMINYLARGDASGAKVEARRVLINRKYLEGAGAEAETMMALGSYLSGFAFEVAGHAPEAMRHYADAKDAGGLPTLKDAVRRLSARTGDTDKRLEAWTRDATLSGDDDERGEVLVIVQTGMAPFLRAERLPIGAALVAASDPGRGARLTRTQRRQANVFAAKGLVKWVNFPSLRAAKNRGGVPQLKVDGRPIPGGLALNVERRVKAQYALNRGTFLAAAVIRLISRAAAGALTQAAAKKGGKAGLAGMLIGLAVEGALTAADTPDTRSWVTLPARFHLARARLKAGRHKVTVRYGGVTRTADIKLKAGGWRVINFSDLR